MQPNRALEIDEGFAALPQFGPSTPIFPSEEP